MKLNKFVIATLLAMCVIGFSMSSVSAATYTKDFKFKANKGDEIDVFEERITLNGQNTDNVPFEKHGSWSSRKSITEEAFQKGTNDQLLDQEGFHFTGGQHYKFIVLKKGKSTGTLSDGFFVTRDFVANIEIV